MHVGRNPEEFSLAAEERPRHSRVRVAGPLERQLSSSGEYASDSVLIVIEPRFALFGSKYGAAVYRPGKGVLGWNLTKISDHTASYPSAAETLARKYLTDNKLNLLGVIYDMPRPPSGQSTITAKTSGLGAVKRKKKMVLAPIAITGTAPFVKLVALQAFK